VAGSGLKAALLPGTSNRAPHYVPACAGIHSPYTAPMQKFLSALALLAVAVTARAQVNVEVLFDQEQFLRSESVPLRVKISNFSGQTLRLGDDPDWLGFVVTGEDGKALKQSSALPPVKPFTIESAKSIALRADLMPHFDLNAAGRYGVSVRMKLPQLESELTTEAKKFDVISGVKVWEKEVGVPGTTPPVVRKFALQQATFFKETRLYARVTDASESTVFSVVPLGAMPSASRPVAAVDNSSQMHALFQAGQRNFSYSIITPDGDQIIRQTYDITASRPHLKAESDGRIVVAGGARRVTLSDLPPPLQTNGVAKAK
jgi:hypothetical protein